MTGSLRDPRATVTESDGRGISRYKGRKHNAATTAASTVNAAAATADAQRSKRQRLEFNAHPDSGSGP